MKSPRKILTVAAVAVSALAGLPSIAQAHDGHRGHRHHHYKHHHADQVYYRAPRDCRTSGTTGLIVGGAAGALLGREIDGGRDRATGTILGAGAGALLGREISRKSRC